MVAQVQPFNSLQAMGLSALAAARQSGVNPLVPAAPNSSGAVTGKMIPSQSIAIGVTTVNLVGHGREVLYTCFWYRILLALGLSALALRKLIG